MREKPKNWFCCRATWGGFHVWERGTAKLIAWGKTPHLAWKGAMKDSRRMAAGRPKSK